MSSSKNNRDLLNEVMFSDGPDGLRRVAEALNNPNSYLFREGFKDQDGTRWKIDPKWSTFRNVNDAFTEISIQGRTNTNDTAKRIVPTPTATPKSRVKNAKRSKDVKVPTNESEADDQEYVGFLRPTGPKVPTYKSIDAVIQGRQQPLVIVDDVGILKPTEPITTAAVEPDRLPWTIRYDACENEKLRIKELEAELREYRRERATTALENKTRDDSERIRNFISENNVTLDLVKRGAYLTMKERNAGWKITFPRSEQHVLPRFEMKLNATVQGQKLEKRTPLKYDEVIETKQKQGLLREGHLIERGDEKGSAPSVTIVVPFFPLTDDQVKDGWRVRLDPSSKQFALYQRPRDGEAHEAYMTMTLPPSATMPPPGMSLSVQRYLLNRIQHANKIMKRRRDQR